MATESPCLHTSPRWVETTESFECNDCLTLLPTANGLCSCGRTLDDHTYFRNVGTTAEPVLQEAKVPICPGGSR